MKEQWKPVTLDGGIYAERYEVSNRGRLRDAETKKVRFFSARVGDYIRVVLSANGSRANFGLHKIVANEFIGQCPQGKVVNHIDHDKTNNRVGNLEYVTQRENILAHYSHMRRHRRKRPSDAKVAAFLAEVRRLSLLKGKAFCMADVARSFKISPVMAKQIIGGRDHYPVLVRFLRQKGITHDEYLRGIETLRGKRNPPERKKSWGASLDRAFESAVAGWVAPHCPRYRPRPLSEFLSAAQEAETKRLLRSGRDVGEVALIVGVSCSIVREIAWFIEAMA